MQAGRRRVSCGLRRRRAAGGGRPPRRRRRGRGLRTRHQQRGAHGLARVPRSAHVPLHRDLQPDVHVHVHEERGVVARQRRGGHALEHQRRHGVGELRRTPSPGRVGRAEKAARPQSVVQAGPRARRPPPAAPHVRATVSRRGARGPAARFGGGEKGPPRPPRPPSSPSPHCRRVASRCCWPRPPSGSVSMQAAPYLLRWYSTRHSACVMYFQAISSTEGSAKAAARSSLMV